MIDQDHAGAVTQSPDTKPVGTESENRQPIPMPVGLTLRELRKMVPVTVPVIAQFRYNTSNSIAVEIDGIKYSLRCGIPYVVGYAPSDSQFTYLNPLISGSAPDESNIPTALDDWLVSSQWQTAGIEVLVQANDSILTAIHSFESQQRHQALRNVLDQFDSHLYAGEKREKDADLIMNILESEFPDLLAMQRGRGWNNIIFQIIWDAQTIYLNSIDATPNPLSIEASIQESARRTFGFIQRISDKFEALKAILRDNEDLRFAFALTKYTVESPHESSNEGMPFVVALIRNIGQSITIPSGDCPAQAIAAVDALLTDSSEFPTLDGSARQRVADGHMIIEKEKGIIATSLEGLNTNMAVYHGDESIKQCLETLFAATHPLEPVQAFPYVVFKRPEENVPIAVNIGAPIVINLEDLDP